MSVVVGLANEHGVWIGSDSATSTESTTRRTKCKKVFRVGEFLIGNVGSVRINQLLQYALEVPMQQDGVTDERYMVTVFAEAVRDCLKDGGAIRSESGEDSGMYMNFIVGYRGEIYEVCADFQVNHYDNGIAAIGSGDQFALGAMLALPTLKPKARIEKAIAIASELSPWCDAPFVVEKL